MQLFGAKSVCRGPYTSPAMCCRALNAVVGLAVVIIATVARASEATAPENLSPEAFTQAAFVAQIDGLAVPCAIAIDENNQIYVAETARHHVAVFDAHGKRVRVIGSRGSGPGEMLAPAGVTINEHGELVVDDAGNRRTLVFDRQGTLLRTVREADENKRRIDATKAALADGNTLTVDPRTLLVRMTDETGALLGQWTRYASRPHAGRGLLRAPNAIAVSPDGTFFAVCESLEQRCQVFSLTQREGEAQRDDLSTIPTQLFGDRFAISPEAMAVSFHSEQMVMVVDPLPPHHLITEFGEFGTRFGQFERISDLLFIPAAQQDQLVIAVADTAQRRLTKVKIDRARHDNVGMALTHVVSAINTDKLKFAPTVRTLDWPLQPDAVAYWNDGTIRVIDERNVCLAEIDLNSTVRAMTGSFGSEPSQWRLPVDVAIDGMVGRVYVLDALAQRVWQIGANSTHFAITGDELNAPIYPTALAVGADRTVYVVDAGTCRVLRFEPQGHLLGAFGKRGTGDGEFAWPTDIAITRDGRIAVLDQGHQRVIFFDHDGNYISHFGAGRLDPLPEMAQHD